MLQSVLCMSLKTYALVIGWLGGIGSLLATIFLGIALGFADDVAHVIVENRDLTDDSLEISFVHRVLVSVLVFVVALHVINMVASALLVLGAVKKMHVLLLPWMLNKAVVLFFALMSHVGLWLKIFANSVPILNVFPLILISLTTLVIGWYLFYGIYSLYHLLQAENDFKAPLIPMNNSCEKLP